MIIIYEKGKLGTSQSPSPRLAGALCPPMSQLHEERRGEREDLDSDLRHAPYGAFSGCKNHL